MATTPWRHVGVDWDSGGWVAVGYTDDGDPGVDTYGTFEEVWEEHGDTAKRIVVDIPVGLCDGSDRHDGCIEHGGSRSRKCDRLARTVIGPRSSSVFPAPSRAAVEQSDDDSSFSELNDINRRQTGKGLTRQAASIIPGIQQVDAVLEEYDADETIVEGHPEVCFRAFVHHDLQFHKATAQGMATRLEALDSTTEYEPGTWRDLADQLAEVAAVGLDDLVDALGLALTARAPSEEYQTLPDANPVPTDGKGRPIQMVYRRSEPFAGT